MDTSILKQVMGIEPTYSAWKADILPLNYTCIDPAQSVIIKQEPFYYGFYVLSSVFFLVINQYPQHPEDSFVHNRSVEKNATSKGGCL